MKCKHCNGTGTTNWCVNGTFVDCPYCGGTGEYEPFDLDVELDKLDNESMTNEEWLRTATTEQLATFLAIVQYDGTDLTLKKNHVEKWVEWLKQPHTAR